MNSDWRKWNALLGWIKSESVGWLMPFVSGLWVKTVFRSILLCSPPWTWDTEKTPRFLREKLVLCAAAWVHLDGLAHSLCSGSTRGETLSPSAARDGDQWATFFCSCPTGPPRSCTWPDSCVCSWCVTCLLGFSCLKLQQQAGLALGNGFLPCTGYDNWPWGVVGRRWGVPWICYS